MLTIFYSKGTEIFLTFFLIIFDSKGTEIFLNYLIEKKLILITIVFTIFEKINRNLNIFTKRTEILLKPFTCI